MPFKSSAQMRAAFGGYLGSEMKAKAPEFARATPDIKHLPRHVHHAPPHKLHRHALVSQMKDADGAEDAKDPKDRGGREERGDHDKGAATMKHQTGKMGNERGMARLSDQHQGLNLSSKRLTKIDG